MAQESLFRISIAITGLYLLSVPHYGFGMLLALELSTPSLMLTHSANRGLNDSPGLLNSPQVYK